MALSQVRRGAVFAAVAVAVAAGTVVAVQATSAGAATVGGPAAGPAVVGTGWTKISPSKVIQLETHGKYTSYPYSTTHAAEAGVSYDRAGGVETFKLFNNDASNRGEIRFQNEYAKGLYQFDGDLRVSAPTNDECVVQIFGAQATASAMMIRAFAADGGTLMAMHKHVVLATGIYGKWVHINVIHDANANTAEFYVNDKLATKFAVGASTKHYWKYGIYGTLKTKTAQSEWRDAALYQKK